MEYAIKITDHLLQHTQRMRKFDVKSQAANMFVMSFTWYRHFHVSKNTLLALPEIHRQTGQSCQITDRPLLAEIQLQAFYAQQLPYTLLELELQQLLAPDLPFNGSLLKDLKLCSFQLPGASPIKILQRKFYATLIFKHLDWLINLSSQSECLKNCVV